MTDWGAHHNDIATWALDTPGPREVEAVSLADPIPGGYDAHSEYRVRYAFENGVVMNVATTTDDDPNGLPVRKEGQRNGLRFEGELIENACGIFGKDRKRWVFGAAPGRIFKNAAGIFVKEAVGRPPFSSPSSERTA